MKLTAVYEQIADGYGGYVQDVPGANTQGVTLKEAPTNLKEAVQMVLQANRELAEQELRGAKGLLASRLN